jgi:ABC-2 type transport system permease protein
MFRNEWLKLRTIRSPWLLLGVTQLLIVVGASGPLVRDHTLGATVTAGAAAHVGLLSLAPLLLGIMAVAGEHRYNTIAATYLSVPRRGRVVAAKLAVYSAAGLVFGILGSATVLTTVAIWLAAKGGGIDLTGTELWRTLGGGVAWNVLFAAIGVAIGALVRNLVAAIAATLAWLALVEALVADVLGSGLSRWLPFSAGTALGRVPMGVHNGLPQWGAGAVLVGYAAVLGVAALSTTVRRDVG